MEAEWALALGVVLRLHLRVVPFVEFLVADQCLVLLA